MELVKHLSILSLVILGILGTNRFPSSVNNLFHREIENGIKRLKASNHISQEIRKILIASLKRLENANWRVLVPEISYALDERTRRKFSLLATYGIMPELGPFDKSYGVAMSFLKTVIKAGVENALTLGDLAHVVGDALIKINTDILSEENGKIVRDLHHHALSIALITALDDENLLGTNGGSRINHLSSTRRIHHEDILYKSNKNDFIQVFVLRFINLHIYFLRQPGSEQ